MRNIFFLAIFIYLFVVQWHFKYLCSIHQLGSCYSKNLLPSVNFLLSVPRYFAANRPYLIPAVHRTILLSVNLVPTVRQLVSRSSKTFSAICQLDSSCSKLFLRYLWACRLFLDLFMATSQLGSCRFQIFQCHPSPWRLLFQKKSVLLSVNLVSPVPRSFCAIHQLGFLLFQDIFCY